MNRVVDHDRPTHLGNRKGTPSQCQDSSLTSRTTRLTLSKDLKVEDLDSPLILSMSQTNTHTNTLAPQPRYRSQIHHSNFEFRANIVKKESDWSATCCFREGSHGHHKEFFRTHRTRPCKERLLSYLFSLQIESQGRKVNREYDCQEGISS